MNRDDLYSVNLAFVIDTTSSMGTLLEAAKAQMLEVLGQVSRTAGVRLSVAVVEYRDHPDQEGSFATFTHPLTGDMARLQRTIMALRPIGGGDEPECVWDGVLAACNLSWEPHALRFAILIGDAPPHGAFDRAGVCSSYCKLTLEQVVAAAEEAGVTVHAIAISRASRTRQAFAAIAEATGGRCADSPSPSDAISRVREAMEREFADLPFDARLLEAVQASGGLSVGALAEALGESRERVAAAIARLGRRGFFNELSAAATP